MANDPRIPATGPARRTAIAGAAGLVLGARHAAAQTAPVNLAMGSVAATSGVYAFAVALAAAVRRHDPGLNVTAVEGGGGFDHARLMKRGTLDFSISGSPATADAVRRGTSGFQRDGAWEGVRLMLLRNLNVARVYVRADIAARDGIRSWSELAGKPFGPGVPGTRDMQRAIEANQMFGTGVRMLPGSLDDTVAGVRAGRLVGMVKGSPHDRFDAAMQALHYALPLTVIGFTPDQAARIMQADPLNTLMTTPRGGIRELPDVGPLMELSSAVMVMTSSRMSEEIGHRLVRAAVAGWDEIAAAFPPAGGLDPVRDAFAQVPEGADLPFHAGMIRFAREQGIDVPARLIPPEYAGPR